MPATRPRHRRHEDSFDRRFATYDFNENTRFSHVLRRPASTSRPPRRTCTAPSLSPWVRRLTSPRPAFTASLAPLVAVFLLPGGSMSRLLTPRHPSLPGALSLAPSTRGRRPLRPDSRERAGPSWSETPRLSRRAPERARPRSKRRPAHGWSTQADYPLPLSVTR